MLRSIFAKPIWAVIIALVWTAVMLGYTIAQEVPVGSIKGQVISSHTGRTIAGAKVRLMRGDPDQPDYAFVRGTETGKDGSFLLEDIPAGDYTLEAYGQVHRLPPTKIRVEESRIEDLNLELAPGKPYLKLYINQRTYMSKEKPEILLDGFTEGSNVNITLYRIDTNKLLSGHASQLCEFLANEWIPIKSAEVAASPAIDTVEHIDVPITKRDSEGIYQQRVALAAQKPGIYFVSAKVDRLEHASWISVSDISLITKACGLDLLSYVVHPDTGKPVEGAGITAIEGEKVYNVGATDAQGLLKRNIEAPSGDRASQLIFASKGDSTAFLTSYAYEPSSSDYSIYCYTDRPVYRPGQRVYFKGIVRRFSNDAYQVPGGEVRVEARDKRETLLYSQTLSLNGFGSFRDSFELPNYAPTGEYTIYCTFSGYTESVSFSVAEYRKPEFSVSVEMPKKQCVRGERIKARIRAEYYFGAPVVGTEVEYSISHSDYWSWKDTDEDDEYYDWGYEDYGGYGESVIEGKVKTGADGSAEVEFTTSWKQHDDTLYESDQEYVLYANVTDASRRSSDGSASIIATQGEFDLQINTEQYVSSVNQPSHFTIVTAEFDNRPRRNVDVEITASRATWGKREEYIPDQKTKVKTGSNGRAEFSFSPKKAGSYVVQAICHDRKGNKIKSASWLWVSGKGDFAGYKYPDLEIVLDKKEYNPGDIAKILINSSEQGAMALLTVEGRRLFHHELVKLTDKTTVIELPVEGEYRPNFYVSVCYVKSKMFISQEARAKVSLNEQTINITVTPDKPKYQPGDTANYLVKTLDDKGKPIQAELSLGVVDEAIYAIRRDFTTPIRNFFYARQWNRVNTRYSFPEIYLSGDKAGYVGKVRKKFVDTAYWEPDIVTDSKGEARVSFKMPDNLTTWRATARACTMETAVGQCTSTAICTKPLLVRLETPRFMIQKDEAVISALVHNYLPHEQRVEVSLTAPGLNVKGTRSKTVKVTSSGMQRIEWRVSPHKVGDAVITAYAVSSDARDAMQLTIPVRPHGQRQVETWSGQITNGSASERLVVREDAVDGASELRVRVAPSLASAMLGSLDYLAKYPYGCIEQTMSCFLPDVVVWRAMKRLNIPNPDLEKRLPNMVGTGLNRLYDFQNVDGGWGWCRYDKEDTWMTTYVVYGLLTAQAAGFNVNDEVLRNGTAAISRILTNPEISKDNRMYALYVLSLSENNYKVNRYLEPLLNSGITDARNLALAAMTLENIGDSSRALIYMQQLWNIAEEDNNYVKWSGKDYENFNAPVETSAYALMAALKLTPNDARIPKALRWILSERQQNHWHSTRDTAMVLYVVSEYLSHSKELEPNFNATVKINGKTIQTLHFDRSNLFQPEKELTIGPKDLRSGDNNIKIEAQGPGVLYYTAELTQYVEREPSPKTIAASGITVTREYRKLVSRWNERAGVNRIDLAKSSTATFKSGDIIRVRLVVNSPRVYQRLLVEDYLPAGCEAFDRGRMEPWEWTYWWVDKDVRDERVTFYVERLQKGRNVLEYEIRAGVPGAYRAMPTLVQAMYQPQIVASGIETNVRIRE